LRRISCGSGGAAGEAAKGGGVTEGASTEGTQSRGPEFYVRLCEGISVESGDDGAARIKIPRPDTRFRRFLSFIFRLPGYKILILDETGTEVLSLINGQRSFSDLVRHLVQAHSLDDLQARQSMGAFLNRLSREGIVEMSDSPQEVMPS